MKTRIRMKSFLAILGSTLIGLMFETGADAAPEQVAVEVEFVNPITIVENESLEFGLLDVNLASGNTVVIAPDGSVTDATSRVLGGNQAAADLTVTATTAQSITILVDTIVANTGYTLATFMCNYNDAGADSACDGAGYSETTVESTTLFVGVTLTGDGTAVPGVANGSFTVTISYQ